MKVIQFDSDRQRQRPEKAEQPGELGKVLSMDRLSDKLIKRIILREAKKELAQLNFIFKVTGGDPAQLPTPDQIQAFYEDGIEY